VKLKELRFRNGVTQYDVMLKTGIPQPVVSLIERGYRVPNEDERKRIAKVFKIRPEEIEFEAH